MLANAQEVVWAAFRAGLRPDPRLTVSEWAVRHRVLSQKSSPEPGPWRNARTPYLVEIMDALSPSSPIQEVIFMAGAQLGKTECGNNWLGYIIDAAPGPVLAVQPTVEMAQRFSKQRLAPLLEESERLRGKVRPARSRDSGNTILSKEFLGGVLILTGANSATGLRSMPVRYLFLDEVDACPGDVDGEGDPTALSRARTRNFARRKILETSTPTIQGRSRIERAFETGDRSYYHVPCPHCGKRQNLRWSQIQWEKDQPESVRYICEGCGGGIEERHKERMLSAGEWIPEAPERSRRIRSFHLNSLYSPIGWYSWEQAVRDWIAAQGDQDKLRTFVNTVLAETWREKGEAPEWERLYRRREEYPLAIVPRGAVVLTAGVDVQRDRLELEIIGWGRNLESWSVDYRVLLGDVSSDGPWRALDEVLGHHYPHAGGALLPISRVAVDSGDQTQTVYRYVRAKDPARFLAIKGSDKLRQLLDFPRAVEVDIGGKKLRRGLKLWHVGTDVAKSELYGWLRQEPPLQAGQPYPAGYCHFPQYPEEFFQQLTAEQLVPRIVRGYRRYLWEKTRPRNEALDCRVYARAAAAALGVDRWTEETWTELEQALRPGELQPMERKPKKGGFWSGWERGRRRT